MSRPEPNSTPWQVFCFEHESVALTREEYISQLSQADSLWKCPLCREPAQWDDANLERHEFEQERSSLDSQGLHRCPDGVIRPNTQLCGACELAASDDNEDIDLFEDDLQALRDDISHDRGEPYEDLPF